MDNQKTNQKPRNPADADATEESGNEMPMPTFDEGGPKPSPIETTTDDGLRAHRSPPVPPATQTSTARQKARTPKRRCLPAKGDIEAEHDVGRGGTSLRTPGLLVCHTLMA